MGSEGLVLEIHHVFTLLIRVFTEFPVIAGILSH